MQAGLSIKSDKEMPIYSWEGWEEGLTRGLNNPIGNWEEGLTTQLGRGLSNPTQSGIGKTA